MYYIHSQLEIHTNYTLSDKIKMACVMHGVSFVKYNFKIWSVNIMLIQFFWKYWNIKTVL